MHTYCKLSKRKAFVVYKDSKILLIFLHIIQQNINNYVKITMPQYTVIPGYFVFKLPGQQILLLYVT